MIPKFRAWHKETKKMYGVDGFKISERKIYRCSVANDEFRANRLETLHFVDDNIDDYIVMQSTNLFDRNGVEIFEGDIVNAYDCETNAFEEFITSLTGVVTYHENAFALEKENVFNDLWVCAEQYKIIGNIYENPDLIESVEE